MGEKVGTHLIKLYLFVSLCSIFLAIEQKRYVN